MWGPLGDPFLPQVWKWVDHKVILVAAPGGLHFGRGVYSPDLDLRAFAHFWRVCRSWLCLSIL